MEPMQIGAKELYDAIQEVRATVDTKVTEMNTAMTGYMQTVGPELAVLKERVSRLEHDRTGDKQERQWSAGMRATVVSLALGTLTAVVFGVLSLTVG